MTDRKDIAARIVAMSGMGMGALARVLGTTVATLDRIVVDRDARESTYARIVPRLEDLERKVAAYKAAGAPQPQGTGAAGLVGMLDQHASEAGK